MGDLLEPIGGDLVGHGDGEHRGDATRDVLTRAPDEGERLAAPEGDLALGHRHRHLPDGGHRLLDPAKDGEALRKPVEEFLRAAWSVVAHLRRRDAARGLTR